MTPIIAAEFKGSRKGANDNASSPFLHYSIILQYVIHPITSN
jgi:hypothetical protein